jgi:hypothetical protein
MSLSYRLLPNPSINPDRWRGRLFLRSVTWGGKIAVYRCTQCEKTTTIAMDR